MKVGPHEASLNLYQILDLPEHCTEEQVRRAYRQMAAKYHPDRCGDTSEQAQRRMKEINIAASILLNNEARQRYHLLRQQKNTSSAVRSQKTAKTGFENWHQKRSEDDLYSSIPDTPWWVHILDKAQVVVQGRPWLPIAAALVLTAAALLAPQPANAKVPVASADYKIPPKPVFKTIFQPLSNSGHRNLARFYSDYADKRAIVRPKSQGL